MCWMCDRDTATTLAYADNFFGARVGLTRLHFEQAAANKATDGMWLTGHESGPAQPPALILIGDSVPGDTSSTATLTVGAPHTIGTTETIGDEDFYRVELVAGTTYEIGMYAYPSPGSVSLPGPGGVPQADAYVEIYDAGGNLIVSGDGGAPTLYNNLNSGFDVLLTFTPETSGTFFVNARAYDEDPTNGTTGDTVGDYELFVQEQPPGGYQPYYDVDSPLYALDWGTQVDGSSRNPDGEEGPRETGNAFTGHAWNPYGIEGKNVITYYFAKQGEIFIDEDPTTVGSTDTIIASGFEDWEKNVYTYAFGEYAKVADIVYVEVQTRAEADFILITYEGTPGPGVSLLGRMSPPDEENEGRTEFNANDERWTEEGLAPGGFSFNTLIHELGHGHGLAHPHDNGGRSGIMRGVEPEGVAFDYTTGDFDLNQGVHTMMSYEDGWQTSPYGQAETTDGFGWLGGLMAFDIAAIQDKYGVNEEWATGNNTYVLKDENAPGTYYYSIWDAGGNDTISYSGARDANIDLRAASLQYEYGGGGWMSYAFGIYGGFTIANGVTIENANGGAGDDTLIGNAADNVLNGAGGTDTMTGGLGNDTYHIDRYADVVNENAGEGIDTLVSAVGFVLALGGNVENLTLVGTAGYGLGNSLDNVITGNAQDNYLSGGVGNDTMIGGLGGDSMYGGIGGDTYGVDRYADQVFESAGGGTDTIVSSVGWVLAAGNNVENLSITGGASYAGGNELDNRIIGNAIDNFVSGGGGNDRLHGGLGNDRMAGNAGQDGFYFDTALDGTTNVDDILDFSVADDTIFLDRSVFSGVGADGTLSASAFRAGTTAQDADDRILYDQATGNIFYDADGSGGAAAILFATVTAGTALTNADFSAYVPVI